jgi:hypothetical protein
MRTSPFPAEHPLAELAHRRCGSVHGSAGARACAECWEHVIRDDERVVALFDLPREIEPEPDYIDVVAVERALAGARVRLTTAERREVVDILARAGWAPASIARRLHTSVAVVMGIFDALRPPAAVAPRRDRPRAVARQPQAVA